MLYALPRDCKVRKPAEYRFIFKAGDTLFSRLIVLKYFKRKQGASRIGIVIRKKHVGKAVTRNTFKRQIKEAFRHHGIKEGSYDIVCVVRYHALHATPQEIRQCVERLFEKL